MIVDLDLMKNLPIHLRVEIEENLVRKSFNDSELAEVQKRLIGELSKRQYKRQGRRNGTSTQNYVEARKPKRTPNTTQKVARMFGESEMTLRKRFDVVEKAKTNPEKFELILQKLDQGRISVNNAAYQIKQKQREIESDRIRANRCSARNH